MSKPGQGLFGSMRGRIVLAVVLLLAGSSAVSIAILRALLLDRVEEEIVVDLRQEAEEFELLLGGLDPRTGRPFGADLRAVFDLYFAREVADEGETLLAYVDGQLHLSERSESALAPGQLSEATAYWLTLTGREESSLTTTTGRIRYVALPLQIGQEKGLFVVANFPEPERAEINGAVRVQAVTQFATILIASLLGLLLAGRVLRPLRVLADTAQSISETDLARRIPARGRDEASLIAAAFNDMLERLERAFAAQRRFLDDASHELRVPLTVIRGYVELLEFETDPEERDATVHIITDEIDRMNVIVEDLLLLARAERPGFLGIGQVDVGELTDEVFRKASVLCARPWVLVERAEVVVPADGQRVTQAWMQLAQNACQHTPDGVTISLGSRLVDRSVCLWVHDQGPGLPPADADRIFGRFVKGPGRTGGSGLGLSIVAAIAEAHGGHARLAPAVGPGARFEIILPVAVEPAGEGAGRFLPLDGATGPAATRRRP